MYLPRFLTARLRKMVWRFPVVVVSGARQVGKSTLLQHVFPRWDSVVFDPVQDVENARADPDLFLDNHRTPVVLDEIQYAPELVASIKRRVDRKSGAGQFVLTGSQQWGVMKALAESLAGRATFLDLDGFSLAEIARSKRREPWLLRWLHAPDRFAASAARHRRLKLKTTVVEQLWRGSLPRAQFLPLDAVPDFFAGYHRTYVERDARLMGDFADWQLFGRFVRLAAALSGQEINHSEIGRELGLAPQTSKRWLAILSATYQWFEIPAYHANTIKRVSAKPKGYFADTGLACFSQAISTPNAVASHPLWGPLFETAVVNEIRKQAALLSPKPQLHHWRTHAGAEVDVLLEWNGTWYPIEVKAGTNPGRHDASGVKAFRDTYPRLRIAPGLVVAPVDSFRRITEKDYALPWDLA